MEEVDGVVIPETAANDNPPLGRCPASSYVDQLGTVGSHRHFLSFPTLLKMLQDHPRFVVRRIELCLSLSEFREKYGPDPVTNKLRIVAAASSDPSKGILAIFCSPKAVNNVNEIRSFASIVVSKQDLSSSIMVSLQSDQITSQAIKAAEIWPFKVEITNLLVNVTKPAPLKPMPHLLTDEEKLMNLLKKRYSILVKQLPGTMSYKYEVARCYGLEKRQVVKVTHSTEITGLHVLYRRRLVVFG